MTDVTQDMILEYILRKGGIVKNVDLVRHFKKHLQVDDPKLKDRAREVFKERVNSVAYIKADRGDKYLHLRPEFQFKLSQPPPGRIPNGQRSSVSSVEDPFSPLSSTRYQRDSLLNDLRSPLVTPVTSVTSPPPKVITTSKEPASNNVAGIASPKTSAVLNSYKPLNTPPPSSGSIFSPPSSSKPKSSMDFDLGSSSKPKSSMDFDLGGSSSKPTSSMDFDLGGSSSKPTSSMDFGLGGSSSKPTSSMDFGLGGSDFGSSILAEFGLFGNDTSSNVASTTGLSSSNVSSSTQQTGLSSSNVSSSTRQTGLSSSNVSSSARQTGLSSSNVSSSTRQTGLSSSNVSSSTRQTGLSSSNVSSSTRQTGLSSPSVGDSSSRISGSTSSVGAYTSSPRDSLVDQSRKTSQSSLMSNPAVKNVTQKSDRASSGYGSLGKTSGSTQSAITPVKSSSKPGKPSGSLFDDFESMLTSLDSSLGLLSDLSSTGPSTSSKGPSTSSNGPLTSSKGPSSSQNSTPSITVNSNNGPSYSLSSPSPKASVSSGPSYSQSSPSPKASVSSGPSYSNSSPIQKTSHSSSNLGNSNSSPPPASPGHPPASVAPKPVRNSTSSLVGTTTSTTQNRPPPTTTSGLTNGNPDVKHVTSRRPPPAPSPAPKRTAPKPPTRTSSNLKEQNGTLMTSTLGRHTTASSSQENSPNTNSLGRHSYTPGRGHSSEVKGGDAGQGVGSFGLDFLSSFGSFSTTAGTSLDTAASQPPPPSHPPPASQPPPPSLSSTHKSPPHSPRRHSGSYYSSRPRVQSEETPMIRVDTPSKGSDTSSYNSGRVSPMGPSESGRGYSPSYTVLGPRPHVQDGSTERLSSGPKTHHDSNERIPSGVVLRNRAPSNAPSARRSRNFDKNSNLENKTRHMIMATPPSGRRATHLAPPEVAPKPVQGSQEMTRSREDISQYGDEESVVANSEPDYWDIDPYEKDWMLANAESKMETIHRLFMTEPSLVNRRDFVHGYTAMHWAAKHGRCDLISALVMNGAVVNLKSNGGLTPLHMAAASGHDNAIQFLVQECKADVNARDHGGRRPVDMLSPKCVEKTKVLLSRIDNHGLPLPAMHWVENLSSFSRPRSAANLNRTWSSVGDIDRRHAIDTLKKHKSPKSIRKSFSFKRTRIQREPTSPTRKEKKDKKSKKDRDRRHLRRPVSDAHAYSIQNSYDV